MLKLSSTRVVFVIGSSGTGKTTLATKSLLSKEHGISEDDTRRSCGSGISACEGLCLRQIIKYPF